MTTTIPQSEGTCRHCGRPIFTHPDWKAGAWDLVYLEYAGTVRCDARGDGAVLSSLPHEPTTTAAGASAQTAGSTPAPATRNNRPAPQH